MAPLWAVGRTLVHKAVNMRFETIVFDVSPIVPIGKKTSWRDENRRTLDGGGAGLRKHQEGCGA